MTQEELRKTLSNNIKMYRKRLFLTQEKLAEKTGLSPQTINDIEGCRTWVSDKSLIKISEALHSTPSDLLLVKNLFENQQFSSNQDLTRLKIQLNASIAAQIDSIFEDWINNS